MFLRTLNLLLTVCCLFIVVGCATLPSGVPVSELEQLAVKQAFGDLVDSQQSCIDQIDADVTVSFANLFYHGKINGYLQVMQPAYLRFDGLNPFGLTEFILTTDGDAFTLLAVRKQTGYSGAVAAPKFQQYAPQAFSDDFVFLLNGLVPARGKFTVRRIRAEEKGSGFWLDLDYPDSAKRTKILFHPDKQKIDRIIIIPQTDREPIVVSYQYPLLSGNSCPEPEAIQIDTNGNGVMSIDFSKRYPLTPLRKEHFQVAIPPNYKKVSIQ